MSYQAYLDNIKAKTGLTPADFKALAQQKGLLGPGVKVGELLSWLKGDIGLGHGHAMAIVLALKNDDAPKRSPDEKIDGFFAGSRSNWRPVFDGLMDAVQQFGPDVHTSPTGSYVSLLKGSQKFAILAATAERLDIGLKLKGVTPAGRLEASGAWNAMVTHRVHISAPERVDPEILAWLKQAYDAV